MTCRGGRVANQDAVAHDKIEPYECWSLADGLGGHLGGAVASKTALSAVTRSFLQTPDFSVARLAEMVQTAQDALTTRQRQEPALLNMRSTLVVLLRRSNRMLWTHLGDSRLYWFRGGRILLQTKDHSVPQMLAANGEIEIAQIRHHPDRNRLLRCLGEPGKANPALSPKPQTLKKGDALLLCSDGFWENIDESVMIAERLSADRPQDWLTRMERHLLKQVGEQHDNYSAIAIFVDTAMANSDTHKDCHID